MNDFWQALALVTLGAFLTLGATVLTEAVRARRDDKAEASKRARDDELARRERGSKYALEALAIFSSVQVHIQARDFGDMSSVAKLPEVSRFYEIMLLIPNSDLRHLVKDAMYCVNNLPKLKSATKNVPGVPARPTQILSTASDNLAAWLRGETVSTRDAAQLRSYAAALEETQKGTVHWDDMPARP